MMDHHDLADGELRARLEQRGTREALAERLVQERDDPLTAERIAKILDDR